jgi:uncharacterized protein YkwD
MTNTHRQRFWARPRLLLGCLAAIAALAAPAAAAEAATIEFVVKNERGLPQANAHIFGWQAAVATDPDGRKVLANIDPGDVLKFSRCPFGVGSSGCSAPEAPNGVSYTVPASPPAQVEITLPALSDPNYVSNEPSLSSDERGLLGLINDERQGRGVGKLESATTLIDPADRYINFLNATQQFSHDAFFDSHLRMVDAGWPDDPSTGYGGEVLAAYPTARQTFEGWMHSPGHEAILMDPGADSIGLASVDGLWLADVGACPAAFASQCGLTGDFGDASLLPPSEGGGGDASANPRLRLSSAKRKRAKVKLVYRFDPDDTAAARLSLSQGAATRKLRLRSRHGLLIASGRLSRGAWKAKLSMPETSEFRADEACDKLNMKRLPRAKRRHWVKLPTRSC